MYRRAQRWMAGVAVAACTLAVAPAAAADGGLVVQAGVQGDRDGNGGLHAGLSRGFGDATWLSLAAGIYRADTDTRNGSLSLDHAFGDLVSASLGFGVFDGDDDIDSTTWRGRVTLRPGPWRLSLLAERRRTDVTFQVLQPGGGIRDVDRDDTADGLGASVGVDLDSGVWLSFEHVSYDHSLDIEAINRQVARANRFLDALGRDLTVADLAVLERRIGGGTVVSSSAVASSGSLLDHANTFSAGWQGSRHRAGVEYAFDDSAADGAALRTWTALFAWPLGSAGELELAAGHAGGDDVEGLVFAGLTWFHYR
jgi:hypothetical protein